MNAIEELLRLAPEIELRLNYSFHDRTLLVLAFIHRSFINENRDVAQHNERLEFLGDSILGFLAAEYLYRHLPSNPEGELSYLRSRLVEATSCMAYIHKLDLGRYLLLGKGERMNDGRGRDSIHADLFEAIIGAVYLDGGLEEARRFFLDNFKVEIEEIIKTPLRNWKALFQEYTQKNYQKAPVYNVLSETGPDHSKSFVVSVSVGDQEFGRGVGASKKEAQQNAAADACSRIDV